MATAAFTGLTAGAIHAVAGPDHVLSLAPVSVGRPRGAWRVGLLWGIGHGIGTIVAALGLFLFAAALPLSGLEAWAERLAGVALLVMGIVGLRKGAASVAMGAAQASRSLVVVGCVHGLTGAAALVMLLPAALSSSPSFRALYVGGFALGSTLAMAALTSALAALCRRGRLQRATGWLTRAASVGAVLLGSFWLLGA